MLNGMRTLMEINEMHPGPLSTIVIIFCLMLCPLGPAVADIDIDIFLLNTQFLFDNVEPHGGRVKAPEKLREKYEERAEAIAELIDEHEADIVGLVEIEHIDVLKKVKSHLTDSENWKIVFVKGRDTVTHQDVGILTKYPFVEGSETSFPEEREVFFVGYEEDDANPSKILGVELTIEDQPFYILIAHLISRSSSSDPKRLAQATVVRRQAVKAMMAEKNVIVMGDMNDTPGTPVIKRLRGFDDIWGDFVQTANEVQADNRYTYIYTKKQKNLLDHILLSPSLRDEFNNVKKDKKKKPCEIFDVDEQLSDHRLIIARLRIKGKNKE